MTALGLDPDALVACVSCGLCLSHCPTYRVTGLEIASPRGRIAAMRAVEAGDAPPGGAFVTAMEACVQCRGCESACPSGVRFGSLMATTRAALHTRERAVRHPVRASLEWLAYRVVLPVHAVLVALTWLLLAAQRLHLLPRRLGLPRLSARSLARPLRADIDAHGADVLLFTGCVMDVWQRDVHRASQRVLRATGARVGLPGRGAACCGALHAHAGRLDEARALARRVIAACPGDGPIAVDSAGCGAALREYGELLGSDEARAFSARVRDVTELAVERGLPVLDRRDGVIVVVQDPCHLRHVQHAHLPVHTALAGAYPVVEPADDGLCCGAGGIYSLVQRDLAGRIRERKAASIEAAAGGRRFVVASANPGCSMHLAAAGLPVRHPVELIAEALP